MRCVFSCEMGERCLCAQMRTPGLLIRRTCFWITVKWWIPTWNRLLLSSQRTRTTHKRWASYFHFAIGPHIITTMNRFRIWTKMSIKYCDLKTHSLVRSLPCLLRLESVAHSHGRVRATSPLITRSDHSTLIWLMPTPLTLPPPLSPVIRFNPICFFFRFILFLIVFAFFSQAYCRNT